MNRKRKPHEEEHTDETWLIPYADLLTLLLALFIVLFASSQIDVKKFEELSQSLHAAFDGNISFFENPSAVKNNTSVVGNRSKNPGESDNATLDAVNRADSPEEQFREETKELQKLKEELDRYIAENDLSTQLKTELNSRQLKIVIRDNALFDLGSADVKPEAEKLAVAISELLVKYPDYNVVVSGHTDNLPIRTARFRSNWDLSAFRALNFMNILLENDDLNPARFSTVAYGEHQPVASNETEEGRARNRRVEVSIIRNVTAPSADDAVSVGDL